MQRAKARQNTDIFVCIRNENPDKYRANHRAGYEMITRFPYQDCFYNFDDDRVDMKSSHPWEWYHATSYNDYLRSRLLDILSEFSYVIILESTGVSVRGKSASGSFVLFTVCFLPRMGYRMDFPDGKGKCFLSFL